MKHDEQWLKDNIRKHAVDVGTSTSTVSVIPKHAGKSMCRDYAEHLARWRSIADGELPENGDLVLMIDMVVNGVASSEIITRWVESDRYGYTHWKPIDLPKGLVGAIIG